MLEEGIGSEGMSTASLFEMQAMHCHGNAPCNLAPCPIIRRVAAQVGSKGCKTTRTT